MRHYVDKIFQITPAQDSSIVAEALASGVSKSEILRRKLNGNTDPIDTKLAIRAAKKLWLASYQFTEGVFLSAIINPLTSKKDFTLIEKFLRDRGLWIDAVPVPEEEEAPSEEGIK
jgi:hypothetical protein